MRFLPLFLLISCAQSTWNASPKDKLFIASGDKLAVLLLDGRSYDDERSLQLVQKIGKANYVSITALRNLLYEKGYNLDNFPPFDENLRQVLLEIGLDFLMVGYYAGESRYKNRTIELWPVDDPQNNLDQRWVSYQYEIFELYTGNLVYDLNVRNESQPFDLVPSIARLHAHNVERLKKKSFNASMRQLSANVRIVK